MNELFNAKEEAWLVIPAFRPMKQLVESSAVMESKFEPPLLRNRINGLLLLCVALASIISWETSAEPLTCSLPIGVIILMPTFCPKAELQSSQTQITSAFFILGSSV